MRKMIRSGGMVGVAIVVAGCAPLGIGGPAARPSTGAPVAITGQAAPSALVAVLNGDASGSSLAGLVTATARPREDLTVLQAGTPPRSVLSSTAPAPPVVTVAGRPAAPGKGATSYQFAQYANRLKRWRAAVTTGRQAEVARTRDTLSGWLRGLGLRARAGRLADPPAPASGLAAEAAAAVSALTGLEEEAGNVFGSRRVLVLYTSNLAGRPPAGQLDGDTVLVVTPFLPTAAAASAAQADLLASGAAEAAVVGPEVTGAQLAALVSATLSQGARHDFVSGPVLFANASAALSSKTVAQLTALLPRLRRAGVTAVINGFASTPGSAEMNYTLSYRRAAAVAAFFQAHDVPAASLIIVGHGAVDPIASGGSGLNRRVTVVIEST